MTEDMIDGGATAKHPLLQPLVPSAQRLIEVVAGPFLSDGEWPIHQYVDMTLDSQGESLSAILSAMPTIEGYPLVFIETTGGSAPRRTACSRPYRPQ